MDPTSSPPEPRVRRPIMVVGGGVFGLAAYRVDRTDDGVEETVLSVRLLSAIGA